MPDLDEGDNRSGYRRGSDREIRHLDIEVQRQAEMLIRHEKELQAIRETASVTRTLLLGAEGHGGMMGQLENMNETLSHLDGTLSDRLDRTRTWAIGAVLTFGATGIGVLVTALLNHH